MHNWGWGKGLTYRWYDFFDKETFFFSRQNKTDKKRVHVRYLPGKPSDFLRQNKRGKTTVESVFPEGNLAFFS